MSLYSSRPSGSDATPLVAATSSTTPATRVPNIPSAAQPKPTIEETKDRDHSLKDVSDLLRNMFGIEVDFGGSGSGEEEKKVSESEVHTKAAKEKVVAEEGRTVVPSAKPTSTPVPVTKDTDKDTSTDPLAEISNYLKQFGLDIQFHQPNDEPASSNPAFTTPKPDSPSSSIIPKGLEQNLSGLAGDLFAAFTGALASQQEDKNTNETRKDVKGKGKAKEDVLHDRPESSAAGSGAWAGLTEQEKEESRAIERSFERAEEASLAAETAIQAAKEEIPTATPTTGQTQTETETATDVKPAPAQEETLRSAYNRHANRVNKLEQLDVLSNKLDKLITGFTFPSTLDFQSPSSSTHSSPSLDPVSSAESIKTPSLRVPPLTFSHNNQPYHTQAQALMSLLTSADEITSDGDKAVRKARKEFVRRVEVELGRMEVARGKIWREKNEVGSKSETKPVDTKEEQVNAEDKKTDIEAAEGYELPETIEIEENNSVGISDQVEAMPTTTTSPPAGEAETSDVIFEAPSSPGPTQANDTPSHPHSSNATTVEDEPEATENVSHINKQPDIPIVSIIEQLPPAAATAQLPKDDSSDTEESTRSFTDSEGSDSETEEKKESGKKEDGFVLV